MSTLLKKGKLPEFEELDASDPRLAQVAGGYYPWLWDSTNPNDPSFSPQDSIRCDSNGCRTCSSDDSGMDD